MDYFAVLSWYPFLVGVKWKKDNQPSGWPSFSLIWYNLCLFCHHLPSFDLKFQTLPSNGCERETSQFRSSLKPHTHFCQTKFACLCKFYCSSGGPVGGSGRLLRFYFRLAQGLNLLDHGPNPTSRSSATVFTRSQMKVQHLGWKMERGPFKVPMIQC